MKKPVMSAQERRWRAEDDARTLMRAEEVKSDKKRLNLAAREASKIATEAQQVAKQKTQAASKITKTRGK